tara:strand:+ start:3549 stop:4394 length:846 start_codon:yes stop_codon:yes gene_type:complete
MLALALNSLSYAPVMPAVQPSSVTRTVAPVMETLEDLKTMAPKLNPVVGYWNPLCLGESVDSMKDFDEQAVIGYLRHSEIKHGRIAMAAFVGFIVQENGIHFPWASTLGGLTYAEISAAGSPAAQWDMLPTAAKLQIFGLIFLLELWGEGSNNLAAAGEKHYMKGGKPGFYPSFEPFRKYFGHPVIDLFDPFGFSKNKTPEQKERGLLVEINNGRAAMIGIGGFVSAASVEGSVPALSGLIKHYDGEVMAPFSATDASLPYVTEMLKYPHLPLDGFIVPGF